MTNKYDHLSDEQLKALCDKKNDEITQIIQESGMIITRLVTLLKDSNERLEATLNGGTEQKRNKKALSVRER